MLDIVFLCTVIISVITFKPADNWKCHKDYLSVSNCNILKGVFAVVIIMHHIAQRTTEGFVIDWFKDAGYLAVGVFLFISGYGLTWKCIEDEKYLNGFLKRRVLSVAKPFAIVYLLTFIAYSINRGKILDVSELYIVNAQGDTFVQSSWFVIVILAIYLIFYIITKLIGIKRMGFVIVVMTSIVIVWIFLCINHFGFGNWWCNTSLCFVMGMLWAKYKNKIEKVLQRYYIVSLLTVLIVEMLLLNIWEYPNIITLIKENITDNVKMIIAVWKSVVAVLFVFIVVMLNMKIKITSIVFQKLGNISYEMYLIQGIFFLMYEDYLREHQFVGSFLIIAFTIVGAKGINLVDGKKKCIKTT